MRSDTGPPWPGPALSLRKEVVLVISQPSVLLHRVKAGCIISRCGRQPARARRRAPLRPVSELTPRLTAPLNTHPYPTPHSISHLLAPKDSLSPAHISSSDDFHIQVVRLSCIMEWWNSLSWQSEALNLGDFFASPRWNIFLCFLFCWFVCSVFVSFTC